MDTKQFKERSSPLVLLIFLFCLSVCQHAYFSITYHTEVIKRVESFFSALPVNPELSTECSAYQKAGSDCNLWNGVKGCMSGKRACCLSLPAPLGKVRTFTCCCTCSLPFYAVTFALKLPSSPVMGSPQWASRGRERSENEENVATERKNPAGAACAPHVDCTGAQNGIQGSHWTWCGCDFKQLVEEMSHLQSVVQ